MVHNHSNPEANLVQAYLASESMSYCRLYLSSSESNPQNQTGEGQSTWNLSVVSNDVRVRGEQKRRQLTPIELEQAHWHVLQNCDEVQIYMFRHKAHLLETGIRPDRVDAVQRREFANHFKEKVCLN